MKKNARTNWIIFCMLFVLLGAAGAASTIPLMASGKKIDITMVSQEPDPAEPGAYVDVRFKFENTGLEQAEDVVVEFLEEYPFSVDGSRVQKIGSMWGRQIGDLGVIVKYRLRIDKNAVEGGNDIKIRYRIGDGEWHTIEGFFADIQTHDAIMSVLSVISKPDVVEAGKTAGMGIRIRNMADSLIKDIKISLVLDDVPFAPIGSTNEKTIMKMDSKAEEDVSFRLITEADADSGVYKIPLEIEYSDELGKNYSKSNVISMIIGSKPDVVMTLDSSDIIRQGMKGSVMFKFVNKDIADAKFLYVKLHESRDYEILSSREVYLGNVDSDDYETAEYKVYVNPDAPGKIGFVLDAGYKDANGNLYEEEFSAELTLYSEEEIKQIGMQEGSRVVGWAIVIVIVAAGLIVYFWLRRRRKK